MDNSLSINSKDKNPEAQGLMVRWLVQTTILGLLHAASLFVAARRLDWGWAWAYLAVFLGGQLVAGLILVPRNPELLAERTRLKAEKRDVDRVLAGIMALFGPLATLIVAGLDVRLHWPGHFSPALHVGALAGAALGSLLTVWAMASNRFFLRCPADRNREGPYGRHRRALSAGAPSGLRGRHRFRPGHATGVGLPLGARSGSADGVCHCGSHGDGRSSAAPGAPGLRRICPADTVSAVAGRVVGRSKQVGGCHV